jgi:hypothetical protein
MLAGLLALAAPAAASGDAVPPTPAIERAGPTEPVFLWSRMRCADWDVPDTAARAWRDAEGKVHLLASHLVSRAMVGADLDHVAQDCRILYEGGGKDAPQLFDDRSWIASPYTRDGMHIVALVHNEFQGHLRPALCPSRDYLSCWSNSVTEVAAIDGGYTFKRVTPDALVATLPYRYAGDLGHRSGYFNPSNIFERDGFVYAFFWAEAQGGQKRGACLMRTADPADPKSWRAWDGQGFTVRFADPYAETVSDPGAHLCAPVGEGRLLSMVTSVTRHRGSGLYLALMATERPAHGGVAATTGVVAAASADLIHWSEPALVWQAPLLFKFACSDRDAIFYPSLLDAAAASRNFEDVGDRAFLYYTDLHLEACHVGTNRDLVRVPVELRLGGVPTHAPHSQSAS